MTKTKTQVTELTISEESPSYKRKRMLEVRHIVAKAVKNGQRVDQLGFTGSDIARSQIALQDLLDKERKKRARASQHILALKEDNEFIINMMNFQQGGMRSYINQLTFQTIQQSQQIEAAHEECHRLAVIVDQDMKDKYQMQTENVALKTILKAFMRGAE